MKKPRLIAAMPLRERPESSESPMRPFFGHGVRGDELGSAVIRFSIFMLFTDGQGDWPIEVNLLNVEGVRTGRPLPALVSLDNPFVVEPVIIDTGILITRLGYSFITIDLAGETIARVPFRVYQTDGNTDAAL
jgi:hypothetical protein